MTLLPDSYQCVECLRFIDSDDITHAGYGDMVCGTCRLYYTDTFYCEGECNTEFVFEGIPTECPKCGSYSLKHGYPDTCNLIAQAQLELAQKKASEPLQTPGLLLKFKDDNVLPPH